MIGHFGVTVPNSVESWYGEKRLAGADKFLSILPRQKLSAKLLHTVNLDFSSQGNFRAESLSGAAR